MTSSVEIQSAFEAKAFGITEAAAQQAAGLAQQFAINANILRDQFELFAIKNQYESFEVTEDMISKFAAWLPKVASSLKAQQSSAGTSRLKHASGPGSNARTPLAARSTNPATSTPAARLASLATPNTASLASAQKGQIVASLNWDANANTAEQGAASCRLTPVQPSALLTERFRYFQDTLQDKVSLLNNRILAAERRVEADGQTEPHPVGMACQDTVTAVGRVLCDSAGGRLNSSSLLFEGSVDTSQGDSVPLDVDSLESVRLFPGQVVAVTGTNPSGHKFVASQLRTSFPAPQPKTPLAQLAASIKDAGSAPLSMMIAAGPFLLPDSLAYEPLHAVVAACKERNPSVLLLLGPFVDAQHPKLAIGDIDVTFAELFQAQVVEFLTANLPATTQVAIIPSVQDLHGPFVFPQPPLNLPPNHAWTDRQTDALKMHSLCNPATFACNEVVVGAVSVDVLRHFSGAEYHKGSTEHRLTALAGHLLQQGSYYPMYPPAQGVPLDAALGSELNMLQLPDVLVLPSELAPFAKVVTLPENPTPRSATGEGVTEGADVEMQDARTDGQTDTGVPTHAPQQVLVINPGLACKRAALGTFAHVVIAPHKEAAEVAAGQPASTNAPVSHDVAKRAAVQVVKL